MKIKKSYFPKYFFNRDRKIISNEEALNDVIPIKWNENFKEISKNTSTQKSNNNFKTSK